MSAAAPILVERTNGTGALSLRKWYLDLVEEDGSAMVLYHADVRLGSARIGYGARLTSRPGAPTRTRSVWRRIHEPRQSGNRVEWDARQLGVVGRWEGVDPSVERALLDGPDGAVRWSCVMPRARVVVEIQGRERRGWGYVEVLELTVPPWRLPIDELRWGRFAGANASVVWIEWRGARPLTLVAVNGRERPGGVVGDGQVAWAGGALWLKPGRTLRHGRLGSTVLGGSIARAIAPRAVRGMEEHKQVSRAIFEDGGVRGEGWVIHETVRFAGDRS